MSMNAFQRAVGDIFMNVDFLETCFIEGVKYDCIASQVSSDNSYTSAGLVDEANFTLNLKLPLHKPIKPEDKVRFRGKDWRVGFVEVDSAPAAVRIHLRDLSKP